MTEIYALAHDVTSATIRGAVFYFEISLREGESSIKPTFNRKQITICLINITFESSLHSSSKIRYKKEKHFFAPN